MKCVLCLPPRWDLGLNPQPVACKTTVEPHPRQYTEGVSRAEIVVQTSPRCWSNWRTDLEEKESSMLFSFLTASKEITSHPREDLFQAQSQTRKKKMVWRRKHRQEPDAATPSQVQMRSDTIFPQEYASFPWPTEEGYFEGAVQSISLRRYCPRALAWGAGDDRSSWVG